MPLYVYRCTECGEVFEKMVRFSEADKLPACPTCQSQETQKQVTKAASFGSSAGGQATVSNCGSSGRFS